MSLEKIVARINKLKALSQSNNPHEAAAAAAEAQRLMTEHRIEEATLLSGGEQDQPVVDVDVLQELRNDSRNRYWVASWEGVLAGGVAQANGCRIYFTKRCGKIPGALHIVGRQSDVQATRYLFTLFHREVYQLAERWAAVELRCNPGLAARGVTTSFRLGCAAAISARLTLEEQASRKQLQAASALGHTQASTALVVFNKALEKAEAYIEKRCGTRKRQYSGPTNVGAFRAGMQAGQQVDLGHGKKRIGEGARRLGSAS